MTTRVTIWNEYRHERENAVVAGIYPDGIHGAIKAGIAGNAGFEIRTATLDEPDNGLPDSVLNNTDVLIWWGHKAHGDVLDEVVDRVHKRVLDGMGLVVLHSGHHSKIFKKLNGTTANLKWREENDKERLWVVSPGHPIVDGIGEYIEIEEEEMYGEPFDIAAPDELVFVSWLTSEVAARFSTSVLAMRPIRRITTPMSSKSLGMQCVGPRRSMAPRRCGG